jgi:hypothetical protein
MSDGIKIYVWGLKSNQKNNTCFRDKAARVTRIKNDY